MARLEDIIQYEFEDKKRRALVNLLFTAGQINSRINESLRPLDLTFQQFNILSIIKGQPQGQANVNTIKERMFDRMSNVSRLLNKMVTKGWITKDRCSVDQRVVYLSITDEGEHFRKIGRIELDKMMNSCQKLNLEESELLNSILEKLRLD